MINTLTDADGTIWTFNENREVHSENDLPAEINKDGDKMYYKNGKYHRDGGPAVILHSGGQIWMKEGWMHREDNLPAVICGGDGSKADAYPPGTHLFIRNDARILEGAHIHSIDLNGVHVEGPKRP